MVFQDEGDVGGAFALLLLCFCFGVTPIGALWSSLKLSEALWSSLNIAFALLLLCLCCACAVLCIALNCLALLCCAMLCFASLCILRSTSVDPCISMHGSQWARSLRGLVVVLSDGGLSGSSAMPLGIHSWKSGKALRELVCCLTARPCRCAARPRFVCVSFCALSWSGRG